MVFEFWPLCFGYRRLGVLIKGQSTKTKDQEGGLAPALYHHQLSGEKP
jgi:hypothetical protein